MTRWAVLLLTACYESDPCAIAIEVSETDDAVRDEWMFCSEPDYGTHAVGGYGLPECPDLSDATLVTDWGVVEAGRRTGMSTSAHDCLDEDGNEQRWFFWTTTVRL